MQKYNALSSYCSSVTETDIHLAISLFDSYRASGLKPRDAIHAATMQNNGISQMMSTDKDFDSLKIVARIDSLTYTSSP